jgi:hypothetical protein
MRTILRTLIPVVVVLWLPPAAQAQEPSPPAQVAKTPKTFAVSGLEAFRVAREEPEVAELTAERGRLTTRVELRDDGRWQVGFFDPDVVEVVQVHVDGGTGEVLETWTGDQVAWPMARGYDGQFGHALNSPWVCIPLALVFFLGLLDWRRTFRIAHLDLLVLLSFGVSQAFFNDGEIGVSAPLAYPPLIYLLGRMLWIGFRGGAQGLRPTAPTAILLVACLVAVAFRVTLNIADSGVIDVGYAGVAGADLVTQGEPIYGEGQMPEDVPTGDTYGPANYLAYVPFELALPWSGEWDELPAAHGAAIFFDLAAALGLFVLGTRHGPRHQRGLSPLQRGQSPSHTRPSPGPDALGSRRLGLILAFAWLTYPFTLLALQSNSNDSLVGAILIWGLVALGSPIGRGLLVGLAAMVKFAPLALVPLYVTGERGLAGRIDGWRPRPGALRPVLLAAAGAGFAVVLMLVHPAVDPGLATFYERTVESQLGRESPFSVWGQAEGLEGLQGLVLLGAAALAIAVAFVPRERSTGQIAALGAAVLIASQLAIDHWFYLYIPWFCGLVFIALAAGGATVPPRTTETQRTRGG